MVLNIMIIIITANTNIGVIVTSCIARNWMSRSRRPLDEFGFNDEIVGMFQRRSNGNEAVG